MEIFFSDDLETRSWDYWFKNLWDDFLAWAVESSSITWTTERVSQTVTAKHSLGILVRPVIPWKDKNSKNIVKSFVPWKQWVLLLWARIMAEIFQLGLTDLCACLSGDCSQNYHKNMCKVCHWGLGNLICTRLCQLYYIILNTAKTRPKWEIIFLQSWHFNTPPHSDSG